MFRSVKYIIRRVLRFEKQQFESRLNSLPVKLSVITVVFLLPPVLIVSIVPYDCVYGIWLVGKGSVVAIIWDVLRV